MCLGEPSETKDKTSESKKTLEPTDESVEAAAITTEVEDERQPRVQVTWPEDQELSWIDQALQRVSYSYIGPLLRKGARQKSNDGSHLSQDDLFRLPRAMESSFLSKKFEETYQSEKSKGSKRPLMRTMWAMAAPSFVPAAVCELISVLCQVAIPLVVRELLRLLEEYPAEAIFVQASPYVASTFALLVVNAAANHRHRYLAMQSGITLRGTIVSVVYNRILQLSPIGRLGLTSGEVTNIVAIDTQKLFEVCHEGNLLWAMPLSIILVTIALCVVMGPSTLIGVVVLLLMVPLVERVSSAMLKVRLERVKLTDRRVEITNAMIQGIKVTKLNNYEENYKTRVKQARKAEHDKLRKELFIWALSLFLTVISPTLASSSTFIVYVLVKESNVLTASKTFTVLLLFNALRFPINYFGRLLGRAAQALASMERIAIFLERELRVSGQGLSIHDGTNEMFRSVEDDMTVLRISNASFRVGPPEVIKAAAVKSGVLHNENGFEVSEISFSIRKGEILALVGPVGSGKSTVINGIIQEVPASPGTFVSLRGKVAYVSQSAFIMNTTLRENILFGEKFEQERYEAVLEACCLWTDIELLGESGDLTEIGERGVTLSGGQKQRVALARAAYSRPDIVLLDDPLSALDAGTSKVIFENLRNFLSGAAIVLVTHAAHFLSQVETIVVVSEGQTKFVGTWTELLDFEPADVKTRDSVDHIRSSVQERTSIEGTPNRHRGSAVHRAKLEEKRGKASRGDRGGKLMTVEEREHGLSSMSTWLLWFKRAGGITFLFGHIIFMTVDRGSYVAVEYWLARWTEGAEESVNVFGMKFAPQSDGRSAQAKYLLVYGLVIFASVLTALLRSEWVVTGGSRAAKRVFLSMLNRVLYAPMSYFETTPMGRVLNRFTYDMEVVDMTLTEAMSVLLVALGWGVTAIIVMCTILPWMVLAIVPITVIYWLLLLHYRKSGADLQRLDAVARSPIQAMLAEAIEGNATIRVYGQQDKFIKRFFTITDSSGSALLNFIAAQRWLGIRIELLGSFVVLCATVLVVTLNDAVGLQPGIVALLILWSSNFTITLGFLVDSFSEAEAAITAIERVDAMSMLPQEKPMETEDNLRPPPSWPEHGALEFKDVCMRYRESLPLSLKRLSFKIPGGKRCGIVGRTGAGKSSLTTALFRLVEIESGKIYLDGHELGQLGLSDIRGRPNGMAIIPQDPFLAGTTIRECLDPFQTCNDRDMLSALVDVRLAPALDSYGVLDAKLEEGGSNFSVGERQLLNLARVILMKPRLLVLDEATASIDGETDAFVQHMLRTKFRDSTLLTVAHRLNTIMDYDYILVMSEGRAAELGSPTELLTVNGVFAELVNATGMESAIALKEMAETAEQKRRYQ